MITRFTGRRFADARGFGKVALMLVLVAGVLGGFTISKMFSSGASGAQAEETKGEAAHADELPPGIVEVPEDAQRNSGVKVITVESRTLPATLEVTGVVAPVESRVAHIRPLARGVVRQVSVTLGTRVAAGQPLITLDNIELGNVVGEYRSELASLRQAQTNVDVSRMALERAEGLIKLEAIAQQTLEQRRGEFRNAEAAVASAEARVAKFEEQMRRFGLSEAQVTALRNGTGSAQVPVSQAVLRAPFAGVVTKIDSAIGEQVDGDRELLTIADMSTVWVLADVYERDLAKIRQGAEVTVRVDTYADRTFTGKVSYISDLIDPATRTAKVRAVIANRDGALKLDMFARISVPTTEQREALVIPADAVQQIDNQPVVFVRQSGTRFERRDVTLGASAGDVMEVLRGVKAGETVVAAGSFYLKTALLRERIGDEH